VDDLVIVKGIQTSPTQWTLSQIIQLVPSTSDGQVRVVKIRTAADELIRPITKLNKFIMVKYFCNYYYLIHLILFFVSHSFVYSILYVYIMLSLFKTHFVI